MGYFIFLLLALFTIGCIFYGISAGVQAIQRGFASLAESASDGASGKTPLVTPLPQRASKTAAAPTTPQEAALPTAAQANATAADASAMQRGIEELREIFALYQQGALTRDEFENLKRILLGSLKGAEFDI